MIVPQAELYVAKDSKELERVLQRLPERTQNTFAKLLENRKKARGIPGGSSVAMRLKESYRAGRSRSRSPSQPRMRSPTRYVSDDERVYRHDLSIRRSRIVKENRLVKDKRGKMAVRTLNDQQEIALRDMLVRQMESARAETDCMSDLYHRMGMSTINP